MSKKQDAERFEHGGAVIEFTRRTNLTQGVSRALMYKFSQLIDTIALELQADAETINHALMPLTRIAAQSKIITGLDYELPRPGDDTDTLKAKALRFLIDVDERLVDSWETALFKFNGSWVVSEVSPEPTKEDLTEKNA